MSAIDQTGMRRLNAGATLRVFAAADASVTSAHLVARTGLSRRTIELILADLMAIGWVRESDAPAPSGAGRPKKFYELIADQAVVATVVVDPPMIRAVVADVRGRELGTAALRSPDGSPAAVVAAAIGVAEAALVAAGTDEARLRAVVVGIGGTLSEHGVVLTSPVVGDWIGVDVRAPFADRFADASVLVENDANLTALAEGRSGAARGVPTFVLLIPGVRVSAGIVIDGELHRGFRGSAGELVHLPEFGRDWQAHPVSFISSPEPREREAAREIIVRAAAGEERPLEQARAFMGSIAHLIAVLGWVLAPPIIVLTGGYEGIEPEFRALLDETLDGVDLPDVEVRISSMRPETPLIGGIALALDIAADTVFDPLG